MGMLTQLKNGFIPVFIVMSSLGYWMGIGEMGSELVVKVTPGHGFRPPPRLLKSCSTIFKIFNQIIITAMHSFEPALSNQYQVQCMRSYINR
ncbi:hypothetical protein DIZ60_07055 [Legionella pneumophila]|nr:hypothetical protein DIZ60_07055 [Legionella pneumophila]TIE34519.1 hypothetical protein DIZ61_14670 [Legionella pneumophila]